MTCPFIICGGRQPMSVRRKAQVRYRAQFRRPPMSVLFQDAGRSRTDISQPECNERAQMGWGVRFA